MMNKDMFKYGVPVEVSIDGKVAAIIVNGPIGRKMAAVLDIPEERFPTESFRKWFSSTNIRILLDEYCEEVMNVVVGSSDYQVKNLEQEEFRELFEELNDESLTYVYNNYFRWWQPISK